MGMLMCTGWRGSRLLIGIVICEFSGCGVETEMLTCGRILENVVSDDWRGREGRC